MISDSAPKTLLLDKHRQYLISYGTAVDEKGEVNNDYVSFEGVAFGEQSYTVF